MKPTLNIQNVQYFFFTLDFSRKAQILLWWATLYEQKLVYDTNRNSNDNYTDWPSFSLRVNILFIYLLFKIIASKLFLCFSLATQCFFISRKSHCCYSDCWCYSHFFLVDKLFNLCLYRSRFSTESYRLRGFLYWKKK